MAVAGVVSACVPGARAEGAGEFAELQDRHGGALVTVKFVLKLEGQFGNRESEVEVTGAMIDPSGLVLCGNSRLGMPSFMRRFGNATPTDLKVLVGDDTEGLKARVLARDTELDLAWVQITEVGKLKFPYLDLGSSAVPAPGDRLLSIRRMAKYFDRAMTVSEGRLAGKTRKPRDLYIPSGSMTIEPGLPVFTPDGRVVGVAVLQLPDDEEQQANPLAFAGIGRDIANGLILPCEEVRRATARARQTAASDEEEGDSPPADEPAADKQRELTPKPDAGPARKVKPPPEDEEEGEE
jgi:hypothetical protein